MVEINKENVCTFYYAYLGLRFQNIEFAVHFSSKNILLHCRVYKPHIYSSIKVIPPSSSQKVEAHNNPCFHISYSQ